jgi:hypothetical protein
MENLNDGIGSSHAKMINEALHKLESRIQSEITRVEASMNKESEIKKLHDQVNLFSERLTALVKKGKSDYQEMLQVKKGESINSSKLRSGHETTTAGGESLDIRSLFSDV